MSNEKGSGCAKKSPMEEAKMPPIVSPSNDRLQQSQHHHVKLGYGDQFPAALLEEKIVEVRYKEKARKVGIIVSKTLLVISMYSSAFGGKIFNGDFIIKINNEGVKKKAQIYEALENFLKTHEKFTLTVKRPKWLTPTNNVPKGYDLAPGYEYFSGLLVLYPNSTVGLNVKAFSSRVYVVRVEGDSIAVNTCLVGDCIVDVDGTPVTAVTDCSEKIIKALKDKRYVMLTIERAATDMTIRAVRCALFAEKTMPADPKLAVDTQKIGQIEAEKIRAGKVPEPANGILKTQGSGVTGVSLYGTEKPHLEVRPLSEEFTIGCEPYNPLFFHKVKQRGTGGENGSPTGPASQVAQPSSSGGSSTGNQSQSQGSAEKITPATGGEKIPAISVRKARSRTTSKDEDVARKKTGTTDTTSGNNTDLDNSGKKVKDDETEKRKTGKSIMEKLPGTPSPTASANISPQHQPPGPNQNGEVEVDMADKKIDASKKGIRAKASAFKTAIMKPRTGDTQKRK